MSMRQDENSLAIHKDPPENPTCLIDTNGTIKLVNSAFENLTKFSEQELLERQWGEVGLTQNAGSKLIVQESAVSGERWQGDLALQRKNGETFRAYGVTDPLTDNDGRSLGVMLCLSKAPPPSQSEDTGSYNRYRQVTYTISGTV